MNHQILRHIAVILVNTVVYSDALSLHRTLSACFFFCHNVELTINPQYKHILCQVSQKKTNLSCFCQKSEVHSEKKIGVFR